MNLKSRYLASLMMVVGLVLLSQLETACSKSDLSPGEKSVEPQAIHHYGTEAPSDALESSMAGRSRKVIVSHSLTIEVDSIGPAFDGVVKLVKDSGGYTTSTGRRRAPDGSLQAEISMRVPSAKADEALAGLRKLGDVTAERSSGEDITEQYVDLEARLANAQASEKRLLSMMEKRTDKLADVLAVERELTRVRGDIESMQARKRSWDTLTRMVTIEVELREPPRAMPSGGRLWYPIKTALGEAAEGFSQSLHYAIVFLGALIPWLVVLGVPIYLIVRIFRRRKKKEL